MSSSPFLTQHSKRCPLCNCALAEKEKKSVNEVGFDSIRATAELWSQIDERVCKDNPYRSFREVCLRLPNEFDGTFYIHKSCAITFRNKIKIKQAQSKKLKEQFHQCDDHITVDIGESVQSTSEECRKRLLREKSIKRLCFVCNIKTSADDETYNHGGLARCSEQTAADRLKHYLAQRIEDESDSYHEAAKRLDIYLSGSSHDIFAADVDYHKKCYRAFTYSYEKRNKEAAAKMI